MKLIPSLVCFVTFAVIVSPTLFGAAFVSSQTQERPESKVPLYLGTAWYPEQWPESRWDADLTLMEKAHIHFVRITEFAWSTMEPSEGHYATLTRSNVRYAWLRSITSLLCWALRALRHPHG
jgi:beta-galactosidase